MFELVSKYKPSGDQPQAIEKLVEGINNGKKHQVLLGATGIDSYYSAFEQPLLIIKEVAKSYG